MKRLLLLSLFSCLLLATGMHANNTYYVTPTGSGNGNDPTSPTTLQAALAAVNDGDTIRVAQGTYYPTNSGFGIGLTGNPRDSTFYINKNIALMGGYSANFAERNSATNVTTLSGVIGNTGTAADSVYHVVVWNPQANASPGLIEGFTITGGKANGGGIVSVAGSTVYRDGGGGLYVARGTLSVRGNTVTGNSATRGGGVYNTDGILTLTQNTVTGNSATRGGGVYNTDGTLTLTQNTVTGNSAINGGGVENYNGTLTLTQNTVTGNSATNNGGGVYNYQDMTYGGNIIAGNKVTGSGSDIYWDVYGTLASSGYNLIGDGGTASSSMSVIPHATDLTITLANLADVLDGTANAGLFTPTLTDGVVLPKAEIALTLLKVPSTMLAAWSIPANAESAYVDQRGVVINTAGGLYCIGSVSNLRSATPGIFHVSANATGRGYGSSTAPFRSLQSALTVGSLADGDIIRVAQGTYVPSDTIPGTPGSGSLTARDKTFYINKNIALMGGYNANFTARDVATHVTTLSGVIGNTGTAADNAYHVVVWDAVTNSSYPGLIEGFTITGGKANGNGSVTAGGDVYRNAGGGLFVASGTLSVRGNTMTGNSTASGGGGVYNYQGILTLTQNTVTGNSANDGGGVFNDSGILTLTQNTVTGNSAGNNGGGVYNWFGTLTLTQNTVTGNSADYGGGVYNNMHMTYGGNIIAGNKVTGSGSDIYWDVYGTLASSGYNLIGAGGTASTGTVIPDATDLTVASANLPVVLDGTWGAEANVGLFIPTLTNGVVMPLSTGVGSVQIVADGQLGTFVPAASDGKYYDQLGNEIVPAGGLYNAGSVDSYLTVYTISFKENNTEVWPDSLFVENRTMTLPVLTTPRTGFTFAGWCDNAALTGTPLTSLLVSANKTLYAAWISGSQPDPQPSALAVTLIASEGIILNPGAGTHPGQPGAAFTFGITLAAGYEGRTPQVTVNGEPVELQPAANGVGWVYRIPRIYDDMRVVVFFATTGNLNPDAPRLYSTDGSLYIYTPIPATVGIYAVTGQLVAERKLAEGTASFALTTGIYLVRVNDTTYKVVIR